MRVYCVRSAMIESPKCIPIYIVKLSDAAVIDIMTRLIETDIAPLTLSFFNCSLFCNFLLADLQLPALKRYQFQYKLFAGLVLLTSNHMFVSGSFGDKSLS